MKVWVILASVLMMLGCMIGCKGRVVTEYVRGEDDGLREVPSTIKKDLDKMGIINPTGLNIEVRVISSPSTRFRDKKFQGYYKDKNEVHYITAQAGKDGVNITEWEVIVTKENATNLKLIDIAVSTAQQLPGELSSYVEPNGAGGVVGRYFYDVEYKEDKSDEYYIQPVVIRVRDLNYCEKMVRKLQTEGSLESEKVGSIIPDVSEDTNCNDPSHTFNFDQKVVVNLMVDNNQAYALQLEQENKLNAAIMACSKLLAASTAMNFASDYLELDKITKKNKAGETVEKAEWSWANAARFTAKTIYSIYTVYTTIKLAQDGMNCNELGIGSDTAENINNAFNNKNNN